MQQVIEQEKIKKPSKFEVNKVIFEWEAPERPVYVMNGGQKGAFTGGMVLLGLYFFWVGQPLLTIVAGAVFFLLFVLMSVPPQRVKHQLEKAGIRTGDYLYTWDDMQGFWLAEKDGYIMLYVETRLNFPGRLLFIVESFGDATIIVSYLTNFLEYKLLRSKQSGLEKFLEGTYVSPTMFFSAQDVTTAQKNADLRDARAAAEEESETSK